MPVSLKACVNKFTKLAFIGEISYSCNFPSFQIFRYPLYLMPPMEVAIGTLENILGNNTAAMIYDLLEPNVVK